MTNPAFHPEPQLPKRGRRWFRKWWVWYLLALLGSHGVQWRSSHDADLVVPAGVRTAEIPAMRRDGPIAGQSSWIAYRVWGADADFDRLPVVLLHGSPGSGSDFSRMAPLLAAEGRLVISPDLPGFGSSPADVPDYSAAAHAWAVFGLLDAMDIKRAHIVGWSQGGAVALRMAEQQPERMASLTLLAGVGTQETEGSGSYFFEHAKYAFGYAALVGLPKLVPHFGLLDDGGLARAFLRNFWDSDQRPLARVMAQTKLPVLILHGRHDPLVSDWAAEQHHALMSTSRLVMLNASHFIPYWKPELAAEHLGVFLSRHDQDGVAPLVGGVDLLPRERLDALARLLSDIGMAGKRMPWWLRVLVLACVAIFFEDLAIVLVGLVVAGGVLDFGVGAAGVMLGAGVRTLMLVVIGVKFGGGARDFALIGKFVPEIHAGDWKRRFEMQSMRVGLAGRFLRGFCDASFFAMGVTRTVRLRTLMAGGVGLVLKVVLGLGVVLMVGYQVARLGEYALGWVGVAVSVWVILKLVRFFLLMLSWTGRSIIKAKIGRVVRYEFWPRWALYLPIVPTILQLGKKHGGLMVFTSANPGIKPGGGIVGESKSAILDGMSRAGDVVLHAVGIEADDDVKKRAEVAMLAVQEDSRLGGYPVILKPDAGERGFGLELARSCEDVREYARRMSQRFIIQRFHAGPEECGVFWVRDPEPGSGLAGRIFSITRKAFPTITGDGRRTVEQLVRKDRRHRIMAHVFKCSLRDQWTRVPDEGEVVQLTDTGNHSAGCIFSDGADLITPELALAIDRIAEGFAGEDGMGGEGGLDFGRFDLRYQSVEELKQGTGFGVVELNGVTSESTNLYDPEQGHRWAMDTLREQWRVLYKLGEWRKEAGVEPMTRRELVKLVLGSRRG